MTFRAAVYKSIHAGLPGIYNRAVRWITHSKYSHCELIFSDGVAASASYMDGGVRFKEGIDFNTDKWDFIKLPDELEAAARLWFTDHEGDEYDLKGNLHFILGAIGDSNGKEFCSEALAAALGITDPWRFSPVLLYHTLRYAYG